MLQCCGVGGGASTAPQAPQLQDTGSAVGTTTSTKTTIMQDAVLESILEQMRETEARKADLERQRADAQNQLREKIAGRYQGPESIEALQSKIRELEKKKELQVVRHEELSLELTSLRRARSRGPVVGHSAIPTTWPPAGSEIDRIIANREHDTSASRMLHDLDHARGAITTQQPSTTQGILRSSSENLPNLGQHQHHPPHPHALSLGMPTQMVHYAGSPMPLTPMMPGCPPLTPNGPPYHYSEPIPPAPSLSTSQSQPVFQQKIPSYQQQTHTDLPSSHSQSALPSQQKQQQAHTHFTSNQYQESYPHSQTYQPPHQQQQQQQPPQHPASTTYLTSSSQSVIPHYTQPVQTAQTYQLNGSQQATTYPSLSITSHPNGTYSTGASTYSAQMPHHNYSVPQTSIPQTTLSSLPPYSTSSYHSTLGPLTSVPQTVLPFSSVPSSYANSGSTYSTVGTLGTNAFSASGVGTGTSSTGLLQTIGDPLQAMQQLSAQSQANQLQQQAIIQQIQQSLRASSPTTATTSHHYLGSRQMPKIPSSILANPLDRLTNDNIVPEGQVDMLDIPGKGRCYVYIARFTYEPFQHSPNENPEAELPVQGGDYLLVWGQPDEDGFLDAESLDGRRGLVPANFVQKLVGDDLLEFHQAVLGLRDVDDSASTNIPQVSNCFLQDIDLELAALEEGNRNRQAELSAYAELDNIAEEDEQEPPVPAPQHLTLERQLNKSVLIGWTPPDNTHQLESYHVYVDGVLKVTVKATERTRALVEGVDSTRPRTIQPHRISVRSVTHSRRTSRDAACTMVIGKDVALGPTAVKASNVTATSAVISWLPSNSNHQHVVCVNNVEVRTVKPGVYRHTITGLAPSTIYRVTVKAKNLRATHFEDQNTQTANNLACHVHFKTLPKGLPDPPVDIQVEAGPQDGTLLVTWQPVALNGSAVTGYAVYADGKKVTDVDSPTGDHALVDIHKLMGLNPKHITVRTKSRESQSGDSCATAIPCSVLRSGGGGGGTVVGGTAVHLQQHMQDQGQPQPQPSGAGQPDDPNRLRMTGVAQRYSTAPVPSHVRRPGGPRVDVHGQVIIETDENLSDKEIYPGQSMSHMAVPEITKDSASEANYSEEDDPLRRGRGMPMHHAGHSRYGSQMGQQGLPGTHRPGRMGSGGHGGPGGGTRPQDSYYDQSVNQRGRNTGYRGGRGTQAQGGTGHPSSSGQQINKRIRWFVGLFDYNPTIMSPNPDACEDELSFSNGDTIKVYGEKDADGFYWGECRGRQGYIPCNMVQEIDDPNQPGQGQGGRRSRWGDIYASMPVKKMIALYDYDPHELSPNVDSQVELTFRAGNEIYVYGDLDDDGFYMGELNGVRGLVPSNFLTEAADQPTQGQLPPGSRRPAGQSQGLGVRGPPPPPRQPPLPGHRRSEDACIVPVSVPVCHLDSRQQQQQPSLMNNQQHQLQHQQNNPPHLAYQQANHHSYTTVTTSNQHGPTPMGAHQQGPVPLHLQQQGKGRGGAINRGSNAPGGMQGPGQHMQQQPDYQQQQNQPYQQQQQQPSQQNQSYQQQQQHQHPHQLQHQHPQSQGYQQQGAGFGQQGQQFQQPQSQQQQHQQQQQQQTQQQQQQPQQQNQSSTMQSGQSTSKPMRGIPTVLPTVQSKTQQNPVQGQQSQQQPQQQQQQSTGPNLMQKFTEITGASAGGDILSKGKELIFMKFGLGK
ncbi:RIMS binding protein isoform X6 [Halictus rubicundus]|uniref:RIMS binding protein isoform X6 n=1 Tax=Halictus rubicundus TaxID=77578 RepID=UPI0040366211